LLREWLECDSLRGFDAVQIKTEHFIVEYCGLLRFLGEKVSFCIVFAAIFYNKCYLDSF
jgi:hypothetical protein